MKSHHLCTCNFGDALQLGYRQGDDNALGSSHPQQPLANQQAGNSHALLTFKRKMQMSPTLKNLSLVSLFISMQYDSIFTNIENHFPACISTIIVSVKTQIKTQHTADCPLTVVLLSSALFNWSIIAVCRYDDI